MKLFSYVTIILTCVLILMPDNCYSQSYNTFQSEIMEITQKVKWHIGPFRIYPTIRFRDIGYDDNVYRKREEDNPISDYTATISPQFRVFLLFRNRLILSFSENPEYVYFVEEKRERSFNNSYSLSIKFLVLHRFVLSGSNQHRRTRRRATSEFDVRANETVSSYNGSLFYETARGTSFGFSGVERKITYEDITLPEEEIYLSRLLNRKEKSGNFGFYYRILSESYFFINVGYTEYQFEHIESRWRDSFSYQVYSGIQFPLLGRIRGTFSLGYKKLISEQKWKRGFTGLVGNTNLNFRIKRFLFRILYKRDCRFSYSSNIIYFLEDRYGTGISFYLTGFLRLDYNFDYGKSSYPKGISVRVSEKNYQHIKRLDIYRIHTLGIVFRIIRNVGLGVSFNFWQRESNIHWACRERWFLGGYLTYEF